MNPHPPTHPPTLENKNKTHRQAKYGDAFDAVKGRTSVFPFQAVWEGRQKLPDDYYKEFLRWPYFAVTAFTLGAYFAHPLMQSASYYVHW